MNFEDILFAKVSFCVTALWDMMAFLPGFASGIHLLLGGRFDSLMTVGQLPDDHRMVP